MVSKNLVYGFLDESPNLQDKSAFFSIIIILNTNPDEKSYRSIFKRTRKNVLKKKEREVPELKFANSTSQVRIKILKAISKQAIKISAYILDKAGRRIPDTPENYGIVAGFAVSEVLKKYPVMVLTFDKKYTKVADQEEVERATLKVVAKISKKGVLQFKENGDSKTNSILQMADYVAGAVSYKYNLKDTRYWEIIKDLIEQENKESWLDIKAIYKQKEQSTPGLRFSPPCTRWCMGKPQWVYFARNKTAIAGLEIPGLTRLFLIAIVPNFYPLFKTPKEAF